MHADLQGILKNGLGLAAETWKAFQRELGWNNSDIDKVFCHQVSIAYQDLFFRAVELDKSKGFYTVEYLGNVGSCSLPISLAIGIEENRLNAGDKVVLMAGGSGLAAITLGLEW